MSDRGIKKWAPYKTLSEQDFELKRQKNKENFIEKPLISQESAEEINEILVNYNSEPLRIGYYKNGKIIEIIDRIKKIDVYEKKIVLLSRKTLLIKDIVSLTIYEEDEL